MLRTDPFRSADPFVQNRVYNIQDSLIGLLPYGIL
jgi:hypothetical protein